MGKTYLEMPNLGLGTIVSDAKANAEAYSEADGILAGAATRPLSSWQALQDEMTKAGTDGAAADGTSDALNGAGTAACGVEGYSPHF